MKPIPLPDHVRRQPFHTRRASLGFPAGSDRKTDRSFFDGWLGLALFCGLAAIGGHTVIGWALPYLRLLVPR